MDRLDAELVLLQWDEADEAHRRAAAEYGVRELTAEIAALEAEVPAITEAVCSGAAGIRDFPALPRAHECGIAVMSWMRTYPGFSGQWLDLAVRALAVHRTLSALDPDVSWLPPLPGGEHPG